MTTRIEHRDHTLGLDSRAVHAGRDDLTELGVHALPLDFSTTNPLPDIESGGESYERLAAGAVLTDGDSAVYARLWNPTVARFEMALADLEGTEEAVAFSSGMAALTAVLISLLPTGRAHVVAVRPLYGGTDHLLATGLLGTQVTFAAPDEVRGALRPDTGLVILETPANPSLELVDIAAVVRAADGVPVLVDNTFATPVLQNPARFGATFVLHSATKFLGGTVTRWAAWSPPTPSTPPRCVGCAPSPVRCCIRGGPTCSTAACPRSRSVFAPSRPVRRSWPVGLRRSPTSSG